MRRGRTRSWRAQHALGVHGRLNEPARRGRGFGIHRSVQPFKIIEVIAIALPHRCDFVDALSSGAKGCALAPSNRPAQTRVAHVREPRLPIFARIPNARLPRVAVPGLELVQGRQEALEAAISRRSDGSICDILIRQHCCHVIAEVVKSDSNLRFAAHESGSNEGM